MFRTNCYLFIPFTVVKGHNCTAVFFDDDSLLCLSRQPRKLWGYIFQGLWVRA